MDYYIYHKLLLSIFITVYNSNNYIYNIIGYIWLCIIVSELISLNIYIGYIGIILLIITVGCISILFIFLIMFYSNTDKNIVYRGISNINNIYNKPLGYDIMIYIFVLVFLNYISYNKIYIDINILLDNDISIILYSYKLLYITGIVMYCIYYIYIILIIFVLLVCLLGIFIILDIK